MKAEDIHLTDFRRIWLGEVPWSFLVEVGLRSIVLYVLLLISMRLMGRRMASQIGSNEMAALVSLAAAIGIPLEAPDRGLLPAVLAASVIILIQKWISGRAAQDHDFECFVFNSYDILLADGAIDLKNLERTRITKERLFSQLRSCGFSHLGMIKRVYLEPNGKFTVIRAHPPDPGLSIIPAHDKELESTVPVTMRLKVCENCGKRNPSGNCALRCVNCHEKCWVSSIG